MMDNLNNKEPIKQQQIFADVQTVLFCDETKFSKSNNDIEDATFYFAVAIPKNESGRIGEQFAKLLADHRIKAPVFHSKDIFRGKKTRKNLMKDLTSLIISHRLPCFCFKYSKPLLYETTKQLRYLNNDILDFDNPQFQALFYFVIMLNSYLKFERPELLLPKVMVFFDRNVYGTHGTEGFSFPQEAYVLKQMVFTENAALPLLALPDFFSYCFRNAKISLNKIERGEKTYQASELERNSHETIRRIDNSSLFHFLDMDTKMDQFAIVLAPYLKDAGIIS